MGNSGMRRFFWTDFSPAEPALTVESDALKATGRPSMRPTPVTTASAGNSGFWLSANMPSSNSILPSSSRSLRRSRAKSFFCSRLRAWYFSAPPFLMRSISDANCSALSVMGLHSFSKSARERECPSRAGVYDAVEHLRFCLGKVQPCHAERSEVSVCLSRQTLRCAQGDTVRLFKRSSTFLYIEPCLSIHQQATASKKLAPYLRTIPSYDTCQTEL